MRSDLIPSLFVGFISSHRIRRKMSIYITESRLSNPSSIVQEMDQSAHTDHPNWGLIWRQLHKTTGHFFSAVRAYCNLANLATTVIINPHFTFWSYLIGLSFSSAYPITKLPLGGRGDSAPNKTLAWRLGTNCRTTSHSVNPLTDHGEWVIYPV